ncbi:MAG: dual specificity protein phosphatase family protein [Planctomycetes bacterium]|nr:dual specificity protein phosphatase family protein [Planctomycetota bacterium]
MPAPDGFSWVDKPLLAAMALPQDSEEFKWLRAQGLQLLISLTLDPPRRDLVNEAGLLVLHVPVIDMHAPSQEQIELCLSSIAKAHAQSMGVGIHCGAGLGRTGVIVACYFVNMGLDAQSAIARVRRLRPGSIETDEQLEAIEEYARGYGSTEV